jgi:carboxymethylenebutenolidase
MDQRVINLYDRFTHGGISRREFLHRLADLTGSAAAAATVLPLLQSNPAKAAVVAADDPRLVTETVDYDAGGTKMSGYLARGKDKTKRPAIVVVHENRGLTQHIKDVARRLALEGFLVLAVDALSPYGGTPADEDQARDRFADVVKPDETALRIAAAVPFLGQHPESTGNVGAIGFCWGGGMVNRVAVLSPALKAGVAYYGQQVPADQVPAIQAALLLQYAGNDERIDAGIPATRRPSKPMASAIRSTSTKAPSTPSTTTPARRATTRPRPISPGGVPLDSSNKNWGRRSRPDG